MAEAALLGAPDMMRSAFASAAALERVGWVAQRNTVSCRCSWDRAAALLHNVRKFVRQGALSRRGARSVLSCPEHDLVPDRVGMGLDGLRRCGSGTVSVDADAAEIHAKSVLHPGTHGGI